jgi:hypothetical protein
MAKYDDASWHYGGDFPEGLPDENGGIHIGIYLAWCINNDLISEFQKEESPEDLNKVKNREMTGTQFLMANCDGKFTDEDLTDLGNSFTEDYYQDDTDFAETHSSYIDDYQKLIDLFLKEKNIKVESFYHLEDSWDLYDAVAPALDKKLTEWKAYSGIK